MIFRDSAQRAMVCHTLLDRVGLSRLWTADGPAPEALAIVEAEGSPLSGGERVMFWTAWTVWANDERLPLYDLIHGSLDRRGLDAVSGFLRAGAEDRIDDWIAGEIYPPRVLEDKPPTG